MAYVDQQLRSVHNSRFREHLTRIRFHIARLPDRRLRMQAVLSSFVADIAVAHGPTASASMLFYNGIAAAATILDDAWNGDLPHNETSRSGSYCHRGCLRRMTINLHGKAADELRLHQDVFGPIAYRSLSRLRMPLFAFSA